MALEIAPVIIQRLDGTIVFWNSGAEQLYGWSRSEAVGRKSHELLRSELPVPFETIQAALIERGTWAGEFRQRCRNDAVVWVSSQWALHRGAAGEPESVVKVNNDITALKRTAEALSESEATTRSLFEIASQGIMTSDRQGRIVAANAMMEKMFGYGRSELIGAPVEMLLPENLRASHSDQRADYLMHPQVRPMGIGLDLMARRKDGSEFPVDISLSYVEHKQGGLTMAFVSDITARKRAEQEREHLIGQLERALSEKTILLKEVHHRVKNNLAVIAGLLGMQSDALEDEHAKEALKETQRRVMSMALIHEYVYGNEHLDRVNFGQYMRQFVDELSGSLALRPELIAVDLQAEDLNLPVHRAIPCGLILSELLSNAMKYAFPDGRSGEIKVRFARVQGDELTLSCQDNGVGLPDGFDWRSTLTLGLRIVNILSRQIDGRLTVESSPSGTRFELRFPGHQV
jgi:PAS domain S-box-containing protein